MLTKKDLTPSLNKAIRDKYYENKSFIQISKECNCSARAVAFSLKEQGINTKLKNRYIVNSNYFNLIDSEYKKYLLGLINADGCLGKNNYFAIQMIDKELIEKIAAELNLTKNIRIAKLNDSNYPNGKKAYRINFSDQNIWIQLHKNNAKDYYWENIELTKDGIYNWSFLLGFFDGDGCAYINKNRSGGLLNIIAPHVVCEKIKKFTEMGSVQKHNDVLSYWRIHGKDKISKFYANCYQNDFGLKRKKIKIERLIDSYENYKKTKSDRSECL